MRYRIRLIIISITFFIFGACQVESPEAPKLALNTLSIQVSADMSMTRTTIADGGMVSNFNWEEGDGIGFFAEDLLTNEKLVCNDAENRLFSGEIQLNENQLAYEPSMHYYSYYPYREDVGVDASSLHAILPAVQKAPFDGESDFLVATPVTDCYRFDNMPNLNFVFNHLFAIVKISVSNTSDSIAEEKITSIGLESRGNALAGAFTFDVVNPSENGAVFSADPEELSSAVDVTYEESERPDLGTGVTHTVYAVVNATTIQAGDLLLVVKTTNYNFYLSTSKDVVFSKNQVTVFPTVDLSSITKLSNNNDLLSFTLNDGSSDYPAFDITDSVVSVHVPNGTDLSDMKVYFTHNGNSIKVNGVEQESGGEVAPDFSSFINPPVYTITSESGDSKEYTIRIFDLPIVEVTTPAPIVSKEDWTNDCSFSIKEADGTVTDYGTSVQVRGRGNSTWQRAPKKAYTLKLSSNASVLGMPAENRWNLLANFFDRTHLRNDLFLEMAHRAEGLDWSSHGKFVELFMNGEFLGTYYLCEHTKVSSNRVNITKMSKGDTSGSSITGGYLLEYDKNPDTDPQFISSTCKYTIKVKSPDDSGYDVQWGWIESYINNLEQVLSNTDSLQAHKYLKYMDIDSFVDWYFIHEIAGQTETSGPWSCFMYKDRGGKLHAGPVWDFDKTSLKVGLSGLKINNNLYYKYLFQDPYFVNKLKERWPIFIASMGDLPGYINSQISIMVRAAERDKEMWPPDDGLDGRETWTWNGDAEMTVPAACARLITAYQTRVTQLTTLFNNLSATPKDKGTGNEDFGDQNDQTGDFGFGF